MLGGISFIITLFLVLVLIFDKPMSQLRYNRWARDKNKILDDYVQHQRKINPREEERPKYKEYCIFNDNEYIEFIRREAFRKYIREKWMDYNLNSCECDRKGRYEGAESGKIIKITMSNFGSVNPLNNEFWVFENENILNIAAYKFLISEYVQKFFLKLPYADIVVPTSQYLIASDNETIIRNDNYDIIDGGQDNFNNNWLFYETIVRRLCKYYSVHYRFDFFQSDYLGKPWNQYVRIGGSTLRENGFDSEDDYKRFIKSFETVSVFYDKCIDEVLEQGNDVQLLNLKYNILPKFNTEIEITEEHSDKLDKIVMVPDFKTKEEINRMARKLTKPLKIGF